MNKLIAWFASLSPFKGYFDYKIRILETQQRVEDIAKLERQEEREAFLVALQSITAVAVESAKASQSQANALSTFLDSFKAVDAPRVREWDEEAADKRYLDQHLPTEMQGLDQLGQFKVLIDKMDENWLENTP